jgi:hypothetical protein
VTEAELQASVIELAHLLKWKCAHFRPAMNSHGRWQTAVQGDGVGFPDCVLVRDRVVFCELKAHKGRLSDAQSVWLDELELAGVETHVWRPQDWTDGTIERVLRTQHFSTYFNFNG